MHVLQDAPAAPGGGIGAFRRELLLLGLPTFGLALAITVVSSYLPTVAKQFTQSNTAIGVLIAAEGLFALTLPIALGAWSDRLRTRWGGRLPFVAIGTPVAVAGIVLCGFVGSMVALFLAGLVFFLGYFIAYEPYRALYADLVPDEHAGKAQSSQAVYRGAGTGMALLCGGLLLTLGQAAPFLAAGALLLAACGGFVVLAVRHEAPERADVPGSVRDGVAEVWQLVRHDGRLRAFFVANALWELALGALKTFVILWLTEGLGIRLGSASLAVGAVAAVILVGALLSGRLADRVGREPVMRWAAVAFGAPMAVLAITTQVGWIVLAIIPIALGGGVLLSLPYALLQPLMPADRHGALTGFYSASRGVGVMLGPLLGGLAVTWGADVWSSTEGYAATWVVCGVAALLSIPFLRRVHSDEEL